MFKKILCMLLLAGSAASASATAVTYAGTTLDSGNCIPFGCDFFGPHEGFVYQNIAAFSLKAGDIIAFDTNRTNVSEFHYDLSLAATTSNGGRTATAAGFTKVSSLASGMYGDTILGNYDVAFVVNQAFNFVGGGLIIDFGVTAPMPFGGSSIVWSNDSTYSVGRYYLGASTGDMGTFNQGTAAVGNFRIISNVANVPEPATCALLGLGLLGIGAMRRKGAKSA